MITTTISFAMHILSSTLHIFGPVSRVIQYVLPYGTAMAAVKAKVNFNTRHLKKGDPLPPYNGKLRVYNMRYCPYAQRVILALNAKNIDYEVVNINLVDKPEWLTQKSAFGKVPALEIAENVSIYESLPTVEYIDEVYPQRPLLPKDPVKKVFDKIIIEATTSIHTLLFKAIRSPETINEDNISGFYKALKFVEEQLVARGTKFLHGSEPGYVDYMIWPWFERMPIFLDLDDRLKIDLQKYKVLDNYINNMLKDTVVSDYLVPKEVLLKFLSGYKPGNTPNYDFLTED